MKRITKIRIKRKLPFVLITGLSMVALCCMAQENSFKPLEEDVLLLEVKAVNDTDFRSTISVSDNNSFLKAYALDQFELIGYPQNEEIRWARIKHLKNDKQAVISLPLISKPDKTPLIADTIEATGNAHLVELYFKSLNEGISEEESKELVHMEEEYGVSSFGITSADSSREEKNPYDASAIELKETVPDEINWNTETCPNRIDMLNLQVYPQTSMVKIVNGAEVERQECKDSGVPMSVLWTYVGCDPKIDLLNDVITAMHRPYYIQNGEQVFISDCVEEKERTYEIKESFECSTSFDLSAMKATEQSLLYYDNPDNGTTVTVSECQLREGSRVFDIKSTYDTCSYRPEPSEQRAYQQEKLVYEKDGVTITISPCADSEKTYPIEKEFCFYKEDWSSKLVTSYERDKVNTVQGLFYLTDCQPREQTDIKETTSGCETLHTDYFEAKYSKGWSRFYHIENGTKRYLTECQETGSVYQHQFEIEDWKADFTTHQAVALMSPYIELPSVGRIQLKAPEEYGNSLRVPLAKVREELIGDGVFTYTGCDRYEGQLNKITYLLPNNLEVEEFVPVSEKKYSSNVCRTELEKYQIWVGTGWTCGSTHGCKRPQFAQVYVNFQRLKYKNMVTGELMCEPWEKVSQISAGGNIGSYPGYASLGAHTECGGYAYPNNAPGFCVNGVLTGNPECYFSE